MTEQDRETKKFLPGGSSELFEYIQATLRCSFTVFC